MSKRDPIWFSVFLYYLLFSLLRSPTHAIKKSYIVYLGAHLHGLKPSLTDLDRATESHYGFLGSFLGSNEKAKNAIIYSYNKHINGFAAILEENEAAEVAKHPNVISVFINEGRELHTTHSWEFLGLERKGKVPSKSLWKKANFGEDIIIGNIDTGVWSASESFNDRGMGPIPSRWKGICQDVTEGGVRCNRKLIGARYFNKGYVAKIGRVNSTFETVRDYLGHGTHTLSTVGGSFVSGVSAFGLGKGTAKGGAPKARLAAYKVCWPRSNGQTCFDADIIAAFDAAISDGVDLLSASLGGVTKDYFEDGISVGSFHAVKNGIMVVTSAVNSGPLDGTVGNLAPWLFTVGSSTMDREFTNYVGLGDRKHIKGASLGARHTPRNKFYPLISPANAKAPYAPLTLAMLCLPETLDPKKVKGKIIVCSKGGSGGVNKGIQASLAGAVGMILINNEQSGNELVADQQVLPTSNIDFDDGLVVLAYLNSTEYPMAHLTQARTQLGTKPAPVIATFSGRGPNSLTPEILKPDILAPGVSIISAWTNETSPSDEVEDERRVPYNVHSGTSMSCPHVAAVAALLKMIHPDWSPAALRSAIMTTARTRNNMGGPLLNSTGHRATPFSYGAGHLQPNRAASPGLVYDLNISDYLNFLCTIGYNKRTLKLFSNESGYTCPTSFSLINLNYPSITVPKLVGSVTVTRTLKNVGPPGTYYARVKAPRGISITIWPEKLVFENIGDEKEFKLVLEVKRERVESGYVFGHLVWSDGKHNVRSPIVVKSVKCKSGSVFD